MRTSEIEMATGETFGLRKDETLRLPRGFPVLVRVTRGTVLVTREGDPDDHVLERGDQLIVRESGLGVAWALRDARLSIWAVESPRLAA